MKKIFIFSLINLAVVVLFLFALAVEAIPDPAPVCGNGICEEGEANYRECTCSPEEDCNCDIYPYGECYCASPEPDCSCVVKPGTCPQDCTSICAEVGQEGDIHGAKWGQPTTCCSGLKAVALSNVPYNGACPEIIPDYGTQFLCIECGDGVCDGNSGENKCNCPEDCGRRSGIGNCLLMDIPFGCSCEEGIVSCPLSIREGWSTPIYIEDSGDNGTLLKTESLEVKTSEKLIVQDLKLYMEVNDGENQEIKVPPEQASLAAVQATEQAQTSGVQKIELVQEQEKAVYLITLVEKVKLLMFIPINMNIEAKIDAEEGSVISIKKPWWSIFAW